ncbi:hypothetical protein KKQ11_00505 [Pseudomonas sp. MG-2]|uniref:GDSL-type esterase/lipase family protein n=1 Tax=Pseudomonas sp. MG-2 TaxID=405714 RepID=UPI001C001107|nr:GDSL-type esterase/lipase family protein [Pseudomonas sp. MG-2]MBT9234303.1 hypothetical protein [Pseudomonas sp. MG-2]
MTVSTTDSVVAYVSGGPAYPIPYRFLQNSDIEAVLVKQGGASETLTSAQYTLSGAGSLSGGTLTSTYAAGFLATPGASLTISRVMDAVQPTDLRNQGNFLAETHESVFDRLTMLIQQGVAIMRRALLRPIGKNYYDAENRQIKNLADPTADQDAATRGWTSRFLATLVGSLPVGVVQLASSVLFTRPDGGLTTVQHLSSAQGTEMLGHRGRTLDERLMDSPSPVDSPYSAAGNGVTNDDAAFTLFEASYRGRVINLGGKAFAVSVVPTGNTYINGRFVVGTFNRPAIPYNSGLSVPAKFHRNGGNQLKDLKDRLADPLCQFIGIAFIGDSITWGSGATGTGTGLPPRDGTLSDPRSAYGAPCFVNQFKRYIRDNYKRGDGLAEVVSNWPASSAGESTVLYQNTEILYPRYGQFTVATIGASQGPNDLQTNNSPSGMILSLNNTVTGAQYGHSISFPFTGTRFTLSVRASAGGATDAFIDVLVNGVLVPAYTNFSVQPGNNGLVDDVNNFDQKLEFTIPYIKDGTVEIRSNRNGLGGVRLLSVTCLRIPRQVRIVNNGIIGLTTVSYLANNMDGNASGDGVAVVGTDLFVFCQLGTNDRAWTTGRPRGTNQFEVGLNALLDNAALTGKGVILMAANPSSNEDPSVYPFHMQDVRNIVYRVARDRNLDMIDNYSIFLGLDPATYTADGLHPNDYGHSIMARNIINALEAA